MQLCKPGIALGNDAVKPVGGSLTDIISRGNYIEESDDGVAVST